MTTSEKTRLTYEQLDEVAHLVGQVHGLKMTIEQTLRDISGGHMPEDVETVCESLDNATRHLDDALRSLIMRRVSGIATPINGVQGAR